MNEFHSFPFMQARSDPIDRISTDVERGVEPPAPDERWRNTTLRFPFCIIFSSSMKTEGS